MINIMYLAQLIPAGCADIQCLSLQSNGDVAMLVNQNQWNFVASDFGFKNRFVQLDSRLLQHSYSYWIIINLNGQYHHQSNQSAQD